MELLDPCLRIPQDVHSNLLPDRQVSILDMLEFRLPAITNMVSKTLTRTYLSMDSPTITDTSIIQTIPTPPVKVIKELRVAFEHDARDIQSVQCVHLSSNSGQRLPLWVIAYPNNDKYMY